MDARTQIGRFAVHVNSELTLYVELHNKLQRQQASLWRSIANLFGARIPYDKLLYQSIDVHKRWKMLEEEGVELGARLGGGMSPKDKEFLSVVQQYVRAVSQAVSLLVARQQLMYEISRGASGGEHSYNAYKDLELTYRSSIDSYRAIGTRLNTLYHELLD